MGNACKSNIVTGECFICFNETNDAQHLLQCNICKHVCHRECYRKWWIKRNIRTPRCLYCQQTRTLELQRPWYLTWLHLKQKIY